MKYHFSAKIQRINQTAKFFLKFSLRGSSARSLFVTGIILYHLPIIPERHLFIRHFLFHLPSSFFPLTSSIFHHNRNSATFRPELWHFSPRIMPSSSYHSVRYSRYLMTRHIGIKDVRKQLATICVDRHIFIVAIRIP